MSTDESTNPQWNLGGKLVIKAQVGDDIRRIPIHNEDITYDELVLMMQRVFRGKVTTNDEVLLKYKDEDGDLVTIFDSSDLTSAIQCSRTLKLVVFLNNQNEVEAKPTEPQQTKGVANINAIRKELAGIRDRVIHLLDQLEIASQESTSQESASNVEPEMNGVQTVKAVPIHAKEFDPFQQHNEIGKESAKVSEAFGVEPASQNDRPSNAMSAAGHLQPNVAGMQQQHNPQLPQQPQGIQGSSQHQIQQAQPAPLGSPYPPAAGYQQQQQPAMGQQRFQPPQNTNAYSLSAQQPSPYPQAGYSPQPQQQQQQQPQQAYPQPMPYNTQGAAQPPQQQQQQQQQPNQQMPGAPSYGGPASQQTQAYNPSVPTQQQPGQNLAPNPAGFSYPGYQPTATTPTNPYSRGGGPAPPYASRPQPPQYR